MKGQHQVWTVRLDFASPCLSPSAFRPVPVTLCPGLCNHFSFCWVLPCLCLYSCTVFFSLHPALYKGLTYPRYWLSVTRSSAMDSAFLTPLFSHSQCSCLPMPFLPFSPFPLSLHYRLLNAFNQHEGQTYQSPPWTSLVALSCPGHLFPLCFWVPRSSRPMLSPPREPFPFCPGAQSDRSWASSPTRPRLIMSSLCQDLVLSAH